MGRRPRRQGHGPRAQSFTSVTIQVVQHERTHTIDDTHGNAARFRRGDIIDVYNTQNHATDDGQNWTWNTPILHPTCVFIHMRGVKQENTAKMRRRFREDLTANNQGRLEETGADVIYARHRRWMVHLSRLPQRVKDELRDNKESTIAWDNIKAHICRKIYTVIEDPDQDDNETPVSEDDIPPDLVVTA